jgi:hypothetical protein
MKNTEHKQIVPAVGTKTADENGLSKNKTRDFPIVGIGASAGGLEAMELFLKTCRNIQVWLSLLFNISILLMWEFYRNYCNAILLWKYYRSLIDLKFYLIIST